MTRASSNAAPTYAVKAEQRITDASVTQELAHSRVGILIRRTEVAVETGLRAKSRFGAGRVRMGSVSTTPLFHGTA